MSLHNINIALNGRHFFRVELDNGYPLEVKQKILEDIRSKYPSPEYRVSVTMSKPDVSYSCKEIL